MPITKPFVSLIGMGTGHTVITWHSRASDVGASGHQVGTFYSASVAVEADYFCASHITFEVYTHRTSSSSSSPAGSPAAAKRVPGCNKRGGGAELGGGGGAGGGGAAGGGAEAVRRQDGAVQVQDTGDAGHAVRQHREALPLQLRHPGLHRFHLWQRKVLVPGN